MDRWSHNADKFATDLDAALQNLTSRVQALEQTPKSAPPNALSREEEGRASGHGKDKNYQGVYVGDLPHSTLVKGEHKIYQSPTHTLQTDYTIVVVANCMMLVIGATSIEDHTKIFACLE